VNAATDSRSATSRGHPNAPLTREGRLRLCLRIDAGRPIARIAAEAGISRRCLAEWYTRWRAQGEYGLLPGTSPTWWRHCGGQTKHYYNHERPHAALGGKPPISRTAGSDYHVTFDQPPEPLEDRSRSVDLPQRLHSGCEGRIDARIYLVQAVDGMVERVLSHVVSLVWLARFDLRKGKYVHSLHRGTPPRMRWYPGGIFQAGFFDEPGDDLVDRRAAGLVWTRPLLCHRSTVPAQKAAGHWVRPSSGTRQGSQ
jgi:hypothetical protein